MSQEYDVILRIKSKISSIEKIKEGLVNELSSAKGQKEKIEKKIDDITTGSKDKFDRIKKMEKELENIDQVLKDTELALTGMVEAELKIEKFIEAKLRGNIKSFDH